MKKYKPLNAVKFLLIMLAVVALVVVFAPKAQAEHVSPENSIAEIANCLVLVRNTDMEPRMKASLEKELAEMLDSYVPVYPEMVIKYASRSEGFLVGAAFGRFGDGDRNMSRRKELLAIIANELFAKYCQTKA